MSSVLIPGKNLGFVRLLFKFFSGVLYSKFALIHAALNFLHIFHLLHSYLTIVKYGLIMALV